VPTSTPILTPARTVHRPVHSGVLPPCRTYRSRRSSADQASSSRAGRHPGAGTDRRPGYLAAPLRTFRGGHQQPAYGVSRALRSRRSRVRRGRAPPPPR
jgi:hypothetical protein